MAKFQLEMGSKNPLVVLDDADLAVAVNVAVQGAYVSTGQRCTASSRLIVTDEKQGSLEIHLYFEPDTYRHVASVYTTARTQALGATPESSSQ